MFTHKHRLSVSQLSSRSLNAQRDFHDTKRGCVPAPPSSAGGGSAKRDYRKHISNITLYLNTQIYQSLVTTPYCGGETPPSAQSLHTVLPPLFMLLSIGSGFLGDLRAFAAEVFCATGALFHSILSFANTCLDSFSCSTPVDKICIILRKGDV